MAFPALERSFPSDPRATLAWVITSYGIVFGSLLVIAGRTADRLGSRRVFIAGLTRLHRRVGALRPRAFGRAARRGAGHPGIRRRSAAAGVVEPAARCFPSRTPLAGRRALGRSRRARRRHRSVAWCGADHRRRMALRLLRQCADRSSLPGSRAAACWSSRAPAYRGAAPDYRRCSAHRVHAFGAGARHHRRADLGLGFGAGDRMLCRRDDRRRGVPVPVGSASRTGPRPHALQGSILQRRQRGDVSLRDGILRDAPRQHPLSHERVALPDSRSGSRRDAGSARRRGGVRPGGARGVACWVSARCCSSVSPSSSSGWSGSPPVSVCSTTTSRVWLPGTLIIGLGIGLTFPVLSAAAVSSLHPNRFAVGSAVNQTARQIGGAFGIALLVVILGTPHSLADALTHFHHLWWYAAGTALLSGLACTLISHKPRAAAESSVASRCCQRSPRRGLGGEHPARLARHLHILACRDHDDRRRAIRGAAITASPSAASSDCREAEQRESRAHAAADQRRVLADPAGEHQRVETIERRGEPADDPARARGRTRRAPARTPALPAALPRARPRACRTARRARRVRCRVRATASSRRP